MIKANSSLKYRYGAPSVTREPSSTQSTIPVPTVSDDLGFPVIGWCSPESTTAPSASRFKSTSCLHLLASFMETSFSFSRRTLNLPTVPKLLAAGLPTMISLCFVPQPTGLNLWDVIKRTMRDAKTRQSRWADLMLFFMQKSRWPRIKCTNGHTFWMVTSLY